MKIVLGILSCLLLALSPAFAADKEDEGVLKPYEFVQIDPIILPIIGHSGATQTLSVVITLELYNVNDAEKATELKPRLGDAFLTTLYGSVAEARMVNGQPMINIIRTKQDLKDASARVMGEDVKHDVLIEVLQQQKI